MNPYLEVVHRNLPRLLAMYNRDATDIWCGCGDRAFWAWKTIDFANGTYQGAVHGLALLYRHDLLPLCLSRGACLRLIGDMIRVLPQMMDGRGGLAEALPFEGSFCVTGLVLGDVMAALDILGADLPDDVRQIGLAVCSRMAGFLMVQDEYHGIISNHLATSALGMVRYGLMTDDEAALVPAGTWLSRIRQHAHDEGWMPEYGGADPGYQSWCLSSLAQIAALTPRYELGDLIARGYDFLQYFALPDGGFSHGAGARLTRFLFAGGAEMLAASLPAAEKLSAFAQSHIVQSGFVTLDSVDAPNMVPMFNDTVLAAVHYAVRPQSLLPCVALPEGGFKIFAEAGLSIHRGPTHVALVSTVRGGWMVRMTLDGRETRVTPEPVAQDRNGTLYSASHGVADELAPTHLSMTATMTGVTRMMPTAFRFIVLRLLAVSAFHSLALGNLVKRVLARVVMGRGGQSRGRVVRRIDFAAGTVEDRYQDDGLTSVKDVRGFSPTHMASQGYWQRGDGAGS